MGNFKDLPSELVLDIIARLPTESILSCKLICKPWKNLISHHPSFNRLHRTHLNNSPDSGKLTFLVINDCDQLHYFEDNDEKSPTGCLRRRFNCTPPFTLSSVLGSFNGLVCFYGCRDFTYCICNPVTKEYVLLPKIKRDCDDYTNLIRSSGFGYLSSSNEYKVVEIYHIRRGFGIGGTGFVEIVVYTLGSRKGWRNVGRLDNKFVQISVNPGVFVNGNLHWMDNKDKTVVVFDLTEEKISEHVSPPPLPPDSSYFSVVEFGGILGYVIMQLRYPRFDLWLLKEKSDNNDMKEQVEHALGWKKKFSRMDIQPLDFTRSGGVLCSDGGSLCIYDAVASTSKKLVDSFPVSWIIHHKNTVCLLKELGEEDIKIMESAEIEQDIKISGKAASKVRFMDTLTGTCIWQSQ